MSNTTTTAAKNKNAKPETKAAPPPSTKASAVEPKPPAAATDGSTTAGLGAGWGAVAEAVQKAKEGGIYIKLENDQDSFTGVMMGEPYVRQVVFENSEFAKKNKENKPQTKIAVNFAIIDEKTKEIVGVKIWESGPLFFKNMLTVKDKYKDLSKWALTVVRNGKPKDPKTTYVIMPDHQITEVEMATIAELEPHDLEALANPDDSFDTEKLDKEDAAQ